MRPSAASNPRR
jgi:hypothetical protein